MNESYFSGEYRVEDAYGIKLNKCDCIGGLSLMAAGTAASMLNQGKDKTTTVTPEKEKPYRIFEGLQGIETGQGLTQQGPFLQKKTQRETGAGNAEFETNAVQDLQAQVTALSQSRNAPEQVVNWDKFTKVKQHAVVSGFNSKSKSLGEAIVTKFSNSLRKEPGKKTYTEKGNALGALQGSLSMAKSGMNQAGELAELQVRKTKALQNALG